MLYRLLLVATTIALLSDPAAGSHRWKNRIKFALTKKRSQVRTHPHTRFGDPAHREYFKRWAGGHQKPTRQLTAIEWGGIVRGMAAHGGAVWRGEDAHHALLGRSVLLPMPRKTCAITANQYDMYLDAIDRAPAKRRATQPVEALRRVIEGARAADLAFVVLMDRPDATVADVQRLYDQVQRYERVEAARRRGR